MKKVDLFFLFILFSLIAYSQQWIQKNNFSGQPRISATGFSNGSYGYICMGGPSSTILFNDLWRYDPSLDTWMLVDTFPALPRNNLVSFTIDTISFIGLGYNGVMDVSFKDMYSYNPNTATWTSLSNFPGTYSRGSKAVVLNGKGYVMGGAGNLGIAAVSDELWEYYPASDSWVQRPDFPFAARTGGAAFAIDSLVYYGLGHNHSVNFKDIWAFNPSTNVWVQKDTFPGMGRHNPSVFVINGKAIIGGGHDVGGGVMSDYYIYDPVINSWSPLPSFINGKRTVSSTFSINSIGYIATGRDSSYTSLNDVWEYNDTSLTVRLGEYNKSERKIELYPNPSNGQITISDARGVFSVFDINGKEVFVETLSESNSKEQKLNLTYLGSGLYFYRVIDEVNSTSSSGKLIIK